MDNPGTSLVWNTLGTVMAEQGDTVNAEICSSTRPCGWIPAFAKARYNRGNMRLALGDDRSRAGSIAKTALAQTTAPDEQIMMRLARSTILINLGRVGEGWDAYEARLDPNFADVTMFRTGRPYWTPGDDLNGKSLLLIGEQGLGDEILFANTAARHPGAPGPGGAPFDRRSSGGWWSLFQRSFPDAKVGAHVTRKVDGPHPALRALPGRQAGQDRPVGPPRLSPCASSAAHPTPSPTGPGYLVADAERVAYWRGLLDEALPGPKVGLLWKSAIINSGRHRFFSPFDQWAVALKTPGVSFVNLQYGDCSAEIEQARREFGVEIWTPPGIDLKQDLDDVAALCCAMDLVIGFSNATLEYRCGLRGSDLADLDTRRLGRGWGPIAIPGIRRCAPSCRPSFGEWGSVMDEVANGPGRIRRLTSGAGTSSLYA